MDRIFWLCGSRIKNGQMADEADWAAARDEMEVARRDFINAARHEVAGIKTSVDDVPVARPPLSEITQLFGSPSGQRSPDAASRQAAEES